VMNARRFNCSNCIEPPASQGRIAEYRIGRGQSGAIWQAMAELAP